MSMTWIMILPAFLLFFSLLCVMIAASTAFLFVVLFRCFFFFLFSFLTIYFLAVRQKPIRQSRVAAFL